MQKDVLILAFALSTAVFIVGVFVGFWLDNLRAGEINKNLLSLDNQGNDARLQSVYYQLFADAPEPFCEAALEQNLKFNDQIYQTGLQLDRAEAANRFDPSLIVEKKRYALLQTQFWFNAVNIRRVCDANYSTMVYFYKTFNNTEVSDEQKVQSAINLELKERCGPNLMLVVLPVDLNITTIDAVRQTYQINVTPSLLINEKTVLRGLQNFNAVSRYVDC